LLGVKGDPLEVDTRVPTGDLFIAGDLYQNVSVFPDYVFREDYPLMPLADLQGYIETHKHLPGIRSEREVEAEGRLNMTELQLKLLEKIEELTLYTLAQDKRLRDKENRLERLEAKLENQQVLIERLMTQRGSPGGR
jgi:hypothetical protein